jgi:hypothetical protein
MQQPHRLPFAAIGAALVFGLGLSAPTTAQEKHDHGAPLHGGKVAMTKEYHFEAVFARDGLRLYPRTHEDKAIDTSKLTGTATFYHPNSPRPWFEQKLTAPPASPGQATTSLQATVDLSKVPSSGAKVAFKVSGLPEAAEPTATFSIPFALAASNEIVVARATKDDEKAAAAQKTCPISKEDLDSMGGPLKVSRGDKSTFICCKSCLKEVQANPDKYLGTTSGVKGGTVGKK